MTIKTNRQLRQTYDEINSWYFEGTLPKVPIKFKSKRGRLADTTFEKIKGRYIAKKITIDKKMKRSSRTTLLSLIHEMMHVKLTHGITNKKRIIHCKIPGIKQQNTHPWAMEVRRLAKAGLFDWLI